MPNFNPLSATGLLILARDGEEEVFLGTCFAYGNPDYFLTAAHTIGEAEAADLAIILPVRGSDET